MKKNQKTRVYTIYALFILCLLSACDPCNSVANFDYAAENNAGTAITPFANINFTPSADDGVGYSWDFGDGQFSNQANPTHRYIGAKTYRIILTVLLNNGECTEAVASRSLAVQPLEGVTSSFTMTDKNINSYLIEQGEETEANVTALEVKPFDAAIDTFETVGKAAAETTYLFYTDDNKSVYRYDFDERNNIVIADIEEMNSEYIDTDDKDNHVYWSSVEEGIDVPVAYVYRSNLDGSEQVKKEIWAADITGLEIDEESNLLYYSDGYGIHKINTNYFDGTDETMISIFFGGNGQVSAIHLDEKNNKLYFVLNYGSGQHEARYIDLNTYEAYYLGEIFSELPILAISVNNNENKFYWINQQTQTVERTDLGDFYEYETDWITEVTNPRVLLLSEH